VPVCDAQACYAPAIKPMGFLVDPRDGDMTTFQASSPATVLSRRRPSNSFPQAGMGVASLVLAIISLFSIAVLIIVIVSVDSTFHQIKDDDAPFNTMIGTWTVASALIAVAGIVFGIGGLCKSDRRRSCAAIGLCLNIAIPACFMFLLLLYLSIDPPSRQHARSLAEASHDPPAWKSPAAIFWQCATVGLGISVTMHLRNKRRQRLATLGVGTVDLAVCATCQKRIPRTSRFCRRCGTAMPL
jgi:hypothetical protein